MTQPTSQISIQEIIQIRCMLSVSNEEFPTPEIETSIKLFDAFILNFASNLSPNKGTPQ